MERTVRMVLPLLLLALVAAGCGSGASDLGAGLPAGGQTTDATLFTPNYADSVVLSTGQSRDSALLWWASFPVTIAFANDALSSGQSVQPQVKAAMGRWQSALGSQVSYTCVSGTNASIVVQFSQGKPTDQTLGTTNVTYNPHTRQLASAVVNLPIWDGLTVDDGPNGLLKTACHEMGHALGINGHSPYSADLMYYQGNANGYPDQRDLNTVKTIYSGLFAAGKSRAPAGPPSGRLVTVTIH